MAAAGCRGNGTRDAHRLRSVVVVQQWGEGPVVPRMHTGGEMGGGGRWRGKEAEQMQVAGLVVVGRRASC